jgi:hypothetical protein
MSKPTPGWLGRPVSRRVKVRRSTVLILLAFLVLGAVYFQIRTPPADRDAPGGGDAQQASIIITMPLPRPAQERRVWLTEAGLHARS